MVLPALIYKNSRFFENLLEHRFLFDLCRTLVLRDPPCLANVMRSEVDAFGIDLVIAVDRRTVHIQMKTRSGTPEPTAYSVAGSLWDLPNAVVAWMLYDSATLEPISYYVLGAPLPPRDTFPPASRNGFRAVKMNQATHRKLSIEQVADILFPSIQQGVATDHKQRGG